MMPDLQWEISTRGGHVPSPLVVGTARLCFCSDVQVSDGVPSKYVARGGRDNRLSWNTTIGERVEISSHLMVAGGGHHVPIE